MKARPLPLRRTTCSSRGTATVEMAIVAPLLVFLLFAIIEGGWLVKDSLVLGSACREAARKAGLGRPCAQIISCARTSASSLTGTNITVTMQYQPASGGGWTTLADTTEGLNSAPAGSQIRIMLTYPHPLICGPITSLFANGGGTTSTRTLHATMIAMRE